MSEKFQLKGLAILFGVFAIVFLIGAIFYNAPWHYYTAAMSAVLSSVLIAMSKRLPPNA